jgi:hypothetical protein
MFITMLAQWPVIKSGEVALIMKRDTRGVNYEFQYGQHRSSPTTPGSRRCSPELRKLSREKDCIVRLGASRSARSSSAATTSALEIGPPLGGFIDDDDRPTAPAAVAVISYRLWQRRFQSDPGSLAGRSNRREPFTIVGVADSRFNGASIERIRAAARGRRTCDRRLRGMTWVEVAGRLRPGISRAGAGRIAGPPRELDKQTGRPVEMLLIQTSALSRPGNRAGGFLFFRVMYLGVVLVLLLACANVESAAARTSRAAARLPSASMGRVARDSSVS